MNFLEDGKPRKRYYKTGDIVQKDKEGHIYYLGRTDDQVKIEGHRMNLIEIENKVKDLLPGHKAVMLAFEKIPGVKRLYLFVEGNEIEPSELKDKLAEQLPPMMVPKEIFTISKIPLTTGGKTDKRSLANESLLNT